MPRGRRNSTSELRVPAGVLRRFRPIERLPDPVLPLISFPLSLRAFLCPCRIFVCSESPCPTSPEKDLPRLPQIFTARTTEALPEIAVVIIELVGIHRVAPGSPRVQGSSVTLPPSRSASLGHRNAIFRRGERRSVSPLFPLLSGPLDLDPKAQNRSLK